MIGTKLKEYRLSLGVTGETLAGLAGIKRSWLSQIENEKKYPPVDTFMNIVNAIAKISPLSDKNANEILTEERYEDFRKLVTLEFEDYSIPYSEIEKMGYDFTSDYAVLYSGTYLFFGYIDDYDSIEIREKKIEEDIREYFFNEYKDPEHNVQNLVDKHLIESDKNGIRAPLYKIEEITIPLYEWWYNHILKDFYDTFNTDIEITNEELVIFGALMSLVNPDGTFTPYSSEDITNIPKSLLNEKTVIFDISYIKDKNLKLTLDGRPLSNSEIDMMDVSVSAIRYKRERK
ncbi:helix-turn-helix transcriptional regulator [Lactococcus lactis]|uniref:Helix-turn-helix transcriptional regulator n=1 Tax=Lactococcus lactis TaxID=1358 RepID=A0ABD5GRQ4_9LACT|nr:helix-turn-helix transcriptional regulator [Lactococcus lactis]MDN6545425.1 helix-turn-helix domain-containing protein [Enterococcaceae bacterium]MDQ7159576.1 helix-turn-helix transcriptional regulator [Lactococcus lactis]MDV2619050.1 helix-turn-helix transcriptional regulator [Lactococcus lactis]